MVSLEFHIELRIKETTAKWAVLERFFITQTKSKKKLKFGNWWLKYARAKKRKKQNVLVIVFMQKVKKIFRISPASKMAPDIRFDHSLFFGAINWSMTWGVRNLTMLVKNIHWMYEFYDC